VTTCPTGTYYVNISVPICVTACPANYYAYPINRLCYVGGSCPTSPVRYFSDDTTGLCVTTCPNGYFADNSTGRCLIYCSSNFFADQSTKTCVINCPVGYFRSVVTRSCVRSCTVGYYADFATNNCTTQCSYGTFGDNTTGTCNKICTFPTFGDATVKLCVSICSVGLFADNFTQTCVTATNCYSNTIGDPTINKCINPQSINKMMKIALPAHTCLQIWQTKSVLLDVLPHGEIPLHVYVFQIVRGIHKLMWHGSIQIQDNVWLNAQSFQSIMQIITLKLALALVPKLQLSLTQLLLTLQLKVVFDSVLQVTFLTL